MSVKRSLWPSLELAGQRKTVSPQPLWTFELTGSHNEGVIVRTSALFVKKEPGVLNFTVHERTLKLLLIYCTRNN